MSACHDQPGNGTAADSSSFVSDSWCDNSQSFRTSSNHHDWKILVRFGLHEVDGLAKGLDDRGIASSRQLPYGALERRHIVVRENPTIFGCSFRISSRIFSFPVRWQGRMRTGIPFEVRKAAIDRIPRFSSSSYTTRIISAPIVT